MQTSITCTCFAIGCIGCPCHLSIECVGQGCVTGKMVGCFLSTHFPGLPWGQGMGNRFPNEGRIIVNWRCNSQQDQSQLLSLWDIQPCLLFLSKKLHTHSSPNTYWEGDILLVRIRMWLACFHLFHIKVGRCILAWKAWSEINSVLWTKRASTKETSDLVHVRGQERSSTFWYQTQYICGFHVITPMDHYQTSRSTDANDMQYSWLGVINPDAIFSFELKRTYYETTEKGWVSR